MDNQPKDSNVVTLSGSERRKAKGRRTADAQERAMDDGWRAAFDVLREQLREEVRESRSSRKWQWVAIGALGAWSVLVSLKGLPALLKFLATP